MGRKTKKPAVWAGFLRLHYDKNRGLYNSIIKRGLYYAEKPEKWQR